jgi:Tfp pilus assembly protein PilV
MNCPLIEWIWTMSKSSRILTRGRPSDAYPARPASSSSLGRRGGFTLAEALVAGVLLSLSAGVLSLITTRGMAALERSRDLHRAAGLLDATLTRIDLVGPARAQVEGWTSGQFPQPDDRFAWQAEILPDPNSNLYDVTVTITWTDSGRRPHSARGRTLLDDPPGSHSPDLQWDDL